MSIKDLYNFDEKYILEVMKFLHDPTLGVVEVRIFPLVDTRFVYDSHRRKIFTGKVVSGYYDNLSKIPDDIKPYNGRANIYFTLNPANPTLLARANNRLMTQAQTGTSDDNIVYDRWLPIDIDPIRDGGISKISTSNEELERAFDKQSEIREWLDAKNIPYTFGMSGNGCHILIPLINYPNTPEVREKKERFIKYLSKKFTDKYVDVDKKVFNMARIWKLYGTLSCKGENLEHRPYRESFLQIPTEPLTPIDLYGMMDDIVPPSHPKITYTKKKYKSFDIADYLNYYGVSVQREKDKNGYKVFELTECPFDPLHTNGEAFVTKSDSGALAFNCHHNSCSGYRWADFKKQVGDVKEYLQKGKPDFENVLDDAKCQEARILDILYKGIRSPRKNENRLIGEEFNIMRVLLGLISGKTTSPVNIAMLGESSSGKTEIVMGVSQILPSEWTHVGDIPLSGTFSERSLKYLASYGGDKKDKLQIKIEKKEDKKKDKDDEDEDNDILREINLDGKIITIMDDAGDQVKFIDQIKPLLSRDTFETSFFVAPRSGQKNPTCYKIIGWPIVVTLSTKTEREAESSGRFLTLSPEKPSQAAILKDKMRRKQFSVQPDYESVRMASEYLLSLQKYEVIIPFDLAEVWGELDREQSTRHFVNFLSLISQITVLFQHFRQKLDDDRIIATRGDVEFAHLLIKPLLASMKINVSPSILYYFEKVKERFGGQPFYSKEMEHWAIETLKVSQSTFKNSLWKALRSSGLLTLIGQVEGEDKRRVFYEVSSLGAGISPLMELKIDFELSDEWAVEFSDKLSEPIETLLETYEPEIRDRFPSPKGKLIPTKSTKNKPSVEELMKEVERLNDMVYMDEQEAARRQSFEDRMREP